MLRAQVGIGSKFIVELPISVLLEEEYKQTHNQNKINSTMNLKSISIKLSYI